MVTRMVCTVRFVLAALLLALLPVLAPGHAIAAGQGTKSYTGGPFGQTDSSVVSVGDTGTIQKVTVSMPEFRTGDMLNSALLLIGPQGQTAMLMAQIPYSDEFPISSFDGQLAFDQDTGATLPCVGPPNSPPKVAPGTYRPNACGPDQAYYHTDALPVPPPYGRTLSVFNGTNAAGNWTLAWSVDDDFMGDNYSTPWIRSWSITITYAEEEAAQTPATTAEGAAQALSIARPTAGDIVSHILTVTSPGTAVPTDLAATFPDAFDFSEATAVGDSCGGTASVDRAARTVRYQFNELNTPFTCVVIVKLIRATRAGSYPVTVTGTLGGRRYATSRTFVVGASGG